MNCSKYDLLDCTRPAYATHKANNKSMVYRIERIYGQRNCSISLQ